MMPEPKHLQVPYDCMISMLQALAFRFVYNVAITLQETAAVVMLFCARDLGRNCFSVLFTLLCIFL